MMVGLLALLLLGQADAGPLSGVKLMVRVIAASNDPVLPQGIDPALGPIKRSLESLGDLFRFRSLRLISQQGLDLGWHVPAEIGLPGKRTLTLIPRKLDALGRIEIHLELVASRPRTWSRKLRTDYSTERGGTVLFGGLELDPATPKAGKLFIAVTHEIAR
jgi:hypothetical protein